MPARTRSLKSSHELGKHESSPIRITFNKIRIDEDELQDEFDLTPANLCAHHQHLLHQQQMREARQTQSLDRVPRP